MPDIVVNDKSKDTLQYTQLRSEAMQDIISQNPGFIGRWGLLLCIGILLLLAVSTWLIHYPDIIKTKAVLYATNAPKEIFARQDGRLVKLFAANNQAVENGTVIGFIESNARHEQVILLSRYLDRAVADMQKNNTQAIIHNFRNNFDSLGELQQGYQQFMANFQSFSDYLADGFYLKKKQALLTDIVYLEKNYKLINEQKELMLKDLKLGEESYKVNESLLKGKVISQQDQRNEESKWLNKQLSIPQITNTLLANETQQREKQKEIAELEHAISQQKIIFQQALQTLQFQVNDWKKKYLLVSPVKGKLVFLVPLQENQFMRNGVSVGFVNPADTHYYVEISIPQFNSGKADTGQAVQLRFDAYPYQEFGYVKGEIQYITDIATDSGFIARVRLPDGLVTTQHTTLHYRDGLKAEAQVITKDMRLPQRFFYNIAGLIKR